MNRSERRQHSSQNTGWEPWEKGVVRPDFSEEQIIEMMKLAGITRDEVISQIQKLRQDKVYLNNIYQVNIRLMRGQDGWPDMIHLSIKRRDRKPLGVEHFRDLQRIKNEIIGPEFEAVELYPAESRLVDSIGTAVHSPVTRRVVQPNGNRFSGVEMTHR
jgi:hypothetical protein